MMTLRNTGWDSCGICHVNSSGDPKVGSEVRHPQYQMIKGVAFGDFPSIPSYKYAMMRNDFSCVDCHITNSQKHDFLVPGTKVTHDAEGIRRTSTSLDLKEFESIFKQEKCFDCHAHPEITIEKIKEHQEIIETELTSLKAFYEDWSKKIKALDPNDSKAKTFQEGATYYTFVEADSSKGAHNYEYSRRLLAKARQVWTELR